MPDAIEAPPAPVQDLGKTPTLLETLASQMDISGAPQLRPKELPHITEEKKEEAKPKEKAEEKPPEKPPEKKEEKADLTEEWRKANETVAEKMFKKRGPPKKEEPGDKKDETPAEKKVDEDELGDKGKNLEAGKNKKVQSPRARGADRNEITERAAAAAAEAATRAVSKIIADKKLETAQDPPPKLPQDSLTQAERKQFDVYQELESSQPDRYKGVTAKYLKSLGEIQDYVKTWAKENPGAKFDPDADDHNDFFARVEPDVDEDDWVDAKANLRARDISSQAIKPLNDKLAAMEQDRARSMMEPVIQRKSVEGVHQFLTEFDQDIAAEIAKPDGVKGLQEKDPITAGILNNFAGAMVSLVGEIVRLHDPNAGVQFDSRNPAHKEIADFILSQEERIAKLPANDRMRDGKRFIGRLAYRQLQPDEKSSYWFLDQDDITYLLAQKYALQAKKVRDDAIEKFNRTAETLGYKKIDGAKPAPKQAAARSAQPSATKESPASPEAVSRTSLKTATGTDGKPKPGEAEVILGSLFHRLRS